MNLLNFNKESTIAVAPSSLIELFFKFNFNKDYFFFVTADLKSMQKKC